MVANLREKLILLFVMSALCTLTGRGQSTATLSQQVNQRNTFGVLVATPNTGIAVGNAVTLTYQLDTEGSPAPTADTVQFYDGSTALGSPVAITEIPASNLLPYSQVDTRQGWTAFGTATSVTPSVVSGVDGTSNTGTNVVLPDSTSAVLYAVPSSTDYAGQAMTFSIWVQSSAAAILTLGITDSPYVSASQTNTCTSPGGVAWQRCVLTFTFPAGAGTGFAVSITSAGASSQSVNLWGAQVEQAAQSGPYVSTIGTARATGAQAGTVSLAWDQFLKGAHSVSVSYPGDANYVASTSNTVTLNVGKGTAAVALGFSPLGSSSYGQSTTVMVSVSGSGATPTGTVQLMNGSTLLATGTLSGGTATLTLVGATALPAGSYSMSAVYSGDANFDGATSATVGYTVTQAPASELTITLTSSLNPSVYGDAVTFTVVISSSVGVTPTGMVGFYSGTTLLGTASLDGLGTAAITVPNVTAAVLSAGNQTITVTYNGDGNYQ